MTMNLDHKYDELFQAVSEMRLLCVKSPGDEQLALTFDKVMPETTASFSTIGSALEDYSLDDCCCDPLQRVQLLGLVRQRSSFRM